VAHIRRTHFEQPLNDLKAAIKGLKLGTGLGLMNLQTQLPALGAIGGAAAHWPAVTATSIGFGLVGLHHVTAKERDRIRSDSPVTYLLQAEKVTDPPLLHQPMDDRRRPRSRHQHLDDQFQGMPAEAVGWAAAGATARRSGGGLPTLVVEVAAGGQASGSTSGCVNRMGLPSDRA
jgi:hypothetical protein